MLDTAPCYASTAKSLTALTSDNNETHCAEAEAHVQAVLTGVAAGGKFHAKCGTDFRQGVPSADYYLWWSRLPLWHNGEILSNLRAAAAKGAIRSGGRAAILYDMTQWRDAGQWQNMDCEKNASFIRKVDFNDTARCFANENVLARHKPLCATRSTGAWNVAVFEL